jgi:aminoglycoside phosphotransferase (APT) family kinase protein
MLDSPVVVLDRLGTAPSADVWVVVADGRRLVVKAFTLDWYVAEQPDRVAHEAAVLQLLASTPVPAPRLAAVDPDGSRAGVPVVMMGHIEGTADRMPVNADAVADVLRAIHTLDVDVPRRFRRYSEGCRLEVPRWADDSSVWERAFGVAAGPVPDAATGFIHRDFNTGNVLWDGAAVTGIVDWSAACRGPIGIDAARLRLDLTLAGRRNEAELVSSAVAARGDPDPAQPYWDVVDAVDALPFYPDGVHRVHTWPPDGDLARRGAIEGFVAEALAGLGA